MDFGLFSLKRHFKAGVECSDSLLEPIALDMFRAAADSKSANSFRSFPRPLNFLFNTLKYFFLLKLVSIREIYQGFTIQRLTFSPVSLILQVI